MNNFKYIDCHSHPHDEKFAGDEQFLIDLKNDGGGTIAIGTDYLNTKKAIELSLRYENVWATIGIHPADNHAEIFDEEKFEYFLKMGGAKVVGIGECGLDYYYFEKMFGSQKSEAFLAQVEKEKLRQKEIFIKQIEFSLKHNLPLVLHGRPSKNSMDAYRDMLDILENINNPLARPGDIPHRFARGHAHFFVGNLEIAKRFLDLGFLMSFDGPITFSNEYDAVIKFLPIENIMIETDSPYAAPMPFRGQLNFPKNVHFIAKRIAELKNLKEEEVLEITKNNAIKLFSLHR